MNYHDQILAALERDGWAGEDNVPGSRKALRELAAEGLLVSRIRYVLRVPRPDAREARLTALCDRVRACLARRPYTATELRSAARGHWRDVKAVLAELRRCGIARPRKAFGVTRWELTGYDPEAWGSPDRP